MSGRRLKALKRAFKQKHGRPPSPTSWVSQMGRTGYHHSEIRRIKKAYSRRRETP